MVSVENSFQIIIFLFILCEYPFYLFSSVGGTSPHGGHSFQFHCGSFEMETSSSVHSQWHNTKLFGEYTIALPSERNFTILLNISKLSGTAYLTDLRLQSYVTLICDNF